MKKKIISLFLLLFLFSMAIFVFSVPTMTTVRISGYPRANNNVSSLEGFVNATDNAPVLYWWRWYENTSIIYTRIYEPNTSNANETQWVDSAKNWNANLTTNPTGGSCTCTATLTSSSGSYQEVAIDNNTGTQLRMQISMGINCAAQWAQIEQNHTFLWNDTIDYLWFSAYTNGYTSCGSGTQKVCLFNYHTAKFDCITMQSTDTSSSPRKTAWNMNTSYINATNNISIVGAFVNCSMSSTASGTSYLYLNEIRMSRKVHNVSGIETSAFNQTAKLCTNYTLEAWAQNETTNSSYLNSSIVRRNSLPAISASQINNTTPKINHSLNWTGTMADCDPDTYTQFYQWYNGTTKMITQVYKEINLSQAGFKKTDTVLLESWFNDGYENGSKSNTSSVTILNTAPISNATINNTSPYQDEIIKCNVSYYFDADADALSAEYFRWFNQTVLITGNVSSTINLTPFRKGDNLSCEYIAYDGEENTTIYNTTTNATIQNSAPYATGVNITPMTNDGSYEANCSWGYRDVDNDPATVNSTRWYKNNANIYNNSNNISKDNFTNGDKIICGVIIYDGTINGTEVNSSIVTIDDDVTPIIASLTLSSASIVTNNPITFSVNVTDTASQIFFVKIIIEDPNTIEVIRTFTISSSNNYPNNYSIWNNTYTPITVGTYQILGLNVSDTSGNYYYNTSFATSFSVTAAGGGGGSSGGGGGTIIITPSAGNATVKITTEVGGKDYLLISFPNGTLTKNFEIYNIGNVETGAMLYCKSGTKLSSGASICDYVKFDTLSIDSIPSNIPQEHYFVLETPYFLRIGDKVSFIIAVESAKDKTQDTILVDVMIYPSFGFIGDILKKVFMESTIIKSQDGTQRFAIPNVLIFLLPTLLISLYIGFNKKLKLQPFTRLLFIIFTAIVMATITYLISVVAGA